MFDRDKWNEIFSTMAGNKTRTILTGISIATGIFMLVILLGSSTGLQNGITDNFQDNAENSMTVYGGRTNLAYHGTNPGKYIGLKNLDYSILEKSLTQANTFAAASYIPGMEIVSYKNKFGNFNVDPVSETYRDLNKLNITKGRFLNSRDISENRKVLVMEEKATKVLFTGEKIIGEYINLNGIDFKIVGLFTTKSLNFGEGSGTLYIPMTTAAKLFNSPDHLTQIGFKVDEMSVEESKVLEKRITRILAAQHNFHPNDFNALWINNNIENAKEFKMIFDGVDMVIWFIGVFTLLLGVIGVFNIMMIVVKERTKEIGIRKAIGATPASIIGLVLLESVFITAVSGYLGLIFGIGILELFSSFDIINKFSTDVGMFFVNPQVNLNVAISATIVLVIAGVLAGFFPARKAARIKPVEALKDE